MECLGTFAFPAQARLLLEAAADDPDIELWAPDLVYPEAVSALRQLVLRRALDEGEAAVGVERIVAFPLIVSSTALLLRDAWHLRDAVTVYDACYVVLARRLGGTLVTADGALARMLRGEPVVHLSELE